MKPLYIISEMGRHRSPLYMKLKKKKKKELIVKVEKLTVFKDIIGEQTSKK